MKRMLSAVWWFILPESENTAIALQFGVHMILLYFTFGYQTYSSAKTEFSDVIVERALWVFAVGVGRRKRWGEDKAQLELN